MRQKKDDTHDTPPKTSRLAATGAFIARVWKYCATGVWSDTRRTWQINAIKTLNLSVRSFLNTDLQIRAAALTFYTLLAIVPALAMLFAIGRGFGFQSLMHSQLMQWFPSQRQAIDTAMRFVESYLDQASQGVFVGVGLVVLLWTMISLMSNIEETFNRVWGVATDRTFGRKIVDYTAIMFLLPVLMVCSSGISIFVSTTMIDNPHMRIFSPAAKIALDVAPFLLTWTAFTGMYLLFPNTKVKFKNALISGIMAGTAFQILQYLFMSGQIYVSKYNAIYGSFAFVPLFLVWLQLVWTITLAGTVLCYSSQNIFQFNFSNDISSISLNYRRKIAVVLMTVIVRRFAAQMTPLNATDFAAQYHLPSRLVTDLLHEMVRARLLSVVVSGTDHGTSAYQPAMDTSEITLGMVLNSLNSQGSDCFIPGFSEQFAPVLKQVEHFITLAIDEADSVRLADLDVKLY